MERVSVFEVEVLHRADGARVPLEAARGRHHVNVLTGLKLGHLDVPHPGVLVIHVHLDDDVVAELGAGDVHVLVGVVAADDGRGGAAGRGDGEGVINTVTWSTLVTTDI